MKKQYPMVSLIAIIINITFPIVPQLLEMMVVWYVMNVYIDTTKVIFPNVFLLEKILLTFIWRSIENVLMTIGKDLII